MLLTQDQPTPTQLPVLLRGRRARAGIRWAADAGERGLLQRIIYLIAGAVAVLGIAIACTLYITVMPDGASVAHTNDFLRERRPAIYAVVVLFALGMAGIVWAAGSFAGRLWEADTSKGHRLSFIALTSEFLLYAMVAVLVALVGGLLVLVGHEGTSPEFLHAMYVLILTAPFLLGPLWLPFFVATTMISRRSKLLPRWLEWLGWWAVCWTSVGGIGVFFLSGPFNLENGLLGIGAQTYGPVPWVAASTAWMLAQWAPGYFRQLADSPL